MTWPERPTLAVPLAVLCAWAAGLFTLAVQVVLVREVLATFGGTELLLAAFYATWLASYGLGAWAARRRRHGFWVPASLVLLLAPWCVGALRLSPVVLKPLPGVQLPPVASFAWTVGVACVFGLGAGGLLPAAASMVQAGRQVASLYAAEAAGCLTAGVLFVTWLQRVEGLRALLPPSAGLSACLLLWTRAAHRGMAPRVCLAAALLHAVTWATFGQPLEEMRWRAMGGQGTLVASGNSPHGHVLAFRDEATTWFSFDGTPLYPCEPDPLELLESRCLAALAPHAKKVVVVNHSSPALTKVLPDTVDLTIVQEDPLLASWAPSLCGAPRPVRESVRAFLAKARGIDLLVVYAPPPLTVAANRWYTREFLERAKAALSPTGLLVIPAHLPASHLLGTQMEISRGIFADLRRVFPRVAVTQGPQGWFVASADSAWSLERVLQSQAHDEVVSASLQLLFPPPLVDELLAALAAPPSPAPNTDERPSAYARQLGAWAARMGMAVPAWAAGLAKALAWGAVAGVAAWPWLRRPGAGAACATIGSTGFVAFSTSFMVLMGFQHAVGTLYLHVGLLGATYMAGLSLGAWLGGRRPIRLCWSDLWLAAATLLASFVVARVATPWVYYLLQFGVAFLSGTQFATVSHLLPTGARDVAGRLEGFDRAGATVGAAVTAVLIWAVGFSAGLRVMATLKLVGALAHLRRPG